MIKYKQCIFYGATIILKLTIICPWTLQRTYYNFLSMILLSFFSACVEGGLFMTVSIPLKVGVS